MNRIWGCLCAGLLVVIGYTAAGAVSAPISVGADGVLMKDGKPYRGIGVNYFDCFSRTLDDPQNLTYQQGFDELARRGIPFVRFMACGFWPADWRPYFKDKEAYFKRLDGVVRAAEERGIGLIPSLSWYYVSIPDLVGEPAGQWGNPESKTIAFMKQYVQEVVSRYVNSPAIWAWELGNEYSLSADLPNAAEHRPPIWPTLGTPTSRSEADDITHDMVVTAMTEFGKAVRAIDKARPITSGNSTPRPAAHHMRIERSWTQDSREEFAENLRAVTPDPLNMASIHLYSLDQERFGQKDVPYAEILSQSAAAAAKAGKALFVGEFGASDAPEDGGSEKARVNAMAIIEAIEKSAAPLAALWVFDFGKQETSCNVTANNQRAFLLDAVTDANRRIQNSQAQPAQK